MLPRCRTTILIGLLAILPSAARAQASTAGAPACTSGAACTAPVAGMGAMGMGSMNMDMNMCMKMMEAGDARLDSLANLMHAATGPARTGAMERVIDELLAQRKAMREHMMMHSAMPTPSVGEPGSPGHEGHH